jgi:hypothetical protein
MNSVLPFPYGACLVFLREQNVKFSDALQDLFDRGHATRSLSPVLGTISLQHPPISPSPSAQNVNNGACRQKDGASNAEAPPI